MCYSTISSQNNEIINATHILECLKSKTLIIPNTGKGMGMQNGTLILENSLAVSLPYDLAFVILSIYPNKLKTFVRIKICTQMSVTSLI